MSTEPWPFPRPPVIKEMIVSGAPAEPPVAFLQILVEISQHSKPQDLGLYPAPDSPAERLIYEAIIVYTVRLNPMDLYPADIAVLESVEGWNGGQPRRHTSEGMVQTLQVIPAAMMPATAGDTDEAWEALADFPNCGSWEEVCARKEARDYKTASARYDDAELVEEFKSRAINAAQDWADAAEDPQAEYEHICELLGIPER